MSYQTLSHIVIVVGVVLTAAGGFGSYYYGKKDAARKERESAIEQKKLKNRINALQNDTASIDNKVNLIYKSMIWEKGKWQEVEMKHGLQILQDGEY